MKVVTFVLPLLIMMTAESLAQSRPPDPPQNPPRAIQQPSADQRGTEQLPLVVKIAPAAKSEVEVAQERRERDEKSANDQETILFNGYLVTIGAAQLFVFIAQLGVFGWQARRLRQTVEAASDQSEKMKQSIAESARAASAMENVAEAVQISAKAAVESVTNVKDASTRQLRAYVNTNFAGVVVQNRETGNVRGHLSYSP